LARGGILAIVSTSLRKPLQRSRDMKGILATLTTIVLLSCTQNGTQSPADGATNKRDEVPVEVRFTGLMCHVFKQQAPDGRIVTRTVMLKDAMHESHLYIPKQASREDLARAGVVVADEDGDFWRIDQIGGLAVRVVGTDGSPMQPAPADFPKNGNFDKFVPHLAEVAPTMTKVKDSILAETTDGSEWLAFFELEGGTFDAFAYCNGKAKTKFKKQQVLRDFAVTSALRGSVKPAPALQFRKHNADWKTVSFTSIPQSIEIVFEITQKPNTPKSSHFHLFQQLGNATEWDEVEEVDCPTVGPIPGCSNNQYP
jgi:hypothetical protein